MTGEKVLEMNDQAGTTRRRQRWAAFFAMLAMVLAPLTIDSRASAESTDTTVPTGTVVDGATSPSETTAAPETTAPPETTVAPDATAAPETTAPPETTVAPDATAPPAANVPAPVLGPVTIASDKPDYPPYGLVTLTGTGWAGDEQVRILVNDTLGSTWQHDVIVPVVGNTVTDTFQLPSWFVSDYDITATGVQTGRVAKATFTDADPTPNPSANLDQCANDPAPSSHADGCNVDATQWVNGNLGASKSSYLEGDSIPYRLKFDNLLTSGSHTVTISWDTTKGSKHALDYLTTFNQSVLNANPCLGVTGCSGSSTYPIPGDPQVTGASVTPVAGNFTMFGGTITGVSAYTHSPAGFTGDTTASITITFTASVVNPVLAWGGHIAARSDWGMLNSAVTIPGSPYHTMLDNLDGSGGAQDRSLSNDAVIFPGSITIIKDATPNGSTSFPFTASPAPLTGFSLVDNGTTANTKLFGTIISFTTYTVAETIPLPTGWTLDRIACGVTSPNGGSRNVTLPSVSIDLKEGENVTCTFTDSRPDAQLIVIKHVINDNGGTSVASDFQMTINGITADGGNSFAGAESPGTSKTFSTVGSYNVTESVHADYGVTYSAECTGTIAFGQTKTCTVTNNDVAPKLHLRKVVTNNNGGTATVADFTLTADGTTTNDLSGTSPVDSGAGLKADTWALSESGPDGYDQSAWVCVGGTQDGANITVGVGGEATCTITNNDIAPKLHLRKVVTNDNGGTATVANFTLTADGAGANDVSGTSPVDSAGSLQADTWALSETTVAGYSSSAWVCVGGSQDGANITVGIGGEVTCTITNNDIAPKLHLRKVVTNDNGGTAGLANFTLTADGATTNDLSGTSPVDSGAGLKADTWALSETTVAGYSSSAWVCVGGSQDGANITVGIGGEATCTITNNDIAPKLTLNKVVVNDNGGTALESAWTLTATGNPVTDPASLSGPGAAGGTDVVSGALFDAGTYDLSESAGPAGYAASSWSCTAGQTGTEAKVTLALGADITCTITNNDNTAHLKLIKTVTNDNGGTGVAADWTLTANGSGLNDISGAGGFDQDVDADTYALSESAGPAGYTAGSWSCVINAGAAPVIGASVSLALGDSAVCTINNNDVAPKLHLRKVVTNNNGGTATVADFTLTADGTTTNDLSGTSPVDSGADLKADTWALSETAVAGYSSSAWVCVGGSQDGANITVGIGGEATCTITNNDQQAFITVVKVVVNDNGGTAKPDDFLLTLGGKATTSGVKVPVDPGTYTAGETLLSGYTFTGFSGACGTDGKVTVALGETKTCTLTNNDIQVAQEAPTTTAIAAEESLPGTGWHNSLMVALALAMVLGGLAMMAVMARRPRKY